MLLNCYQFSCPDPRVPDGPNVGVWDAGNEEGMLVARQSDGTLQWRVQLQVAASYEFWKDFKIILKLSFSAFFRRRYTIWNEELATHIFLHKNSAHAHALSLQVSGTRKR